MCDNTELNGPEQCKNNGISDDLIQTSEQIFHDKIEQDEALQVSNKKEIKETDVLLIQNVPDNQWYEEYNKKLLGDSQTDIILEYHKNEIENVTKTLRVTLAIFGFVTLSTFVIVSVSIFLHNNSGAIISGALGTIIDVVLGVAIKFFNTTIQSKKSYFDSECESEKFRLMLSTLQLISNNEKKDLVVEKVVCKFFEIETNN